MARVPARRSKDRVFNDFRRAKLLRKRIPLTEVASAAACALALVAGGLWVASRSDAHDPGERDLDTALLEATPPPADLYNVPLARWREPGSVAAAVAADLGPLPASLLAGGWSAARLQRFTPETLYEKINGQAEQYLKFEFRGLVVVPLELLADAMSIDIFLYDQGTFVNALGLYAEQRGDKAVEVRGPVRFTRTSLGAQGFVGTTVFHLVGSAEHEDVTRKTDEILDALSVLGSAAATPAAYVALSDGLGLSFAAVGYTPANAFQLGFARDFWFGRIAAGGTAQAFVHEAASAEEAAGLAERLHQALSEELEAVETQGTLRVSRHAFLKTWYALGTEGRFVFGAEDVAERATLTDVVARLRSALPRESAPGRDVLAQTSEKGPEAAAPAAGEESE